MSNVWGEIQCKLENEAGEVVLQHSILEPNFFVPEKIVHENPLTGKRTYSKNAHYSEFLITEYLYKYEDANAKADELLNLENTIVLFTPGELMWSKYCIVSLVDFYPLSKPYEKDLAMIKLISTDFNALGNYLTTLSGLILKTKDNKKLRKGIKGLL